MSANVIEPPPKPRLPAPAPEAKVRDAAPQKAGFDVWRYALPLLVFVAFLACWHGVVRFCESDLFYRWFEPQRLDPTLRSPRIFPLPHEVVLGIAELAQKGVLLKYIVASLFRVTWGFTLAVLVGVPFGLWLGWHTRAFHAFNPMIQIFRPISPIAWIPVAIVWFGVTDAAPIYLIFLASVFPIIVAASAAVQNMQPVYIRAAQNFGLSRGRLFRQVIFRACLPQIVTSIRVALGVAWLVVVAAEMIAVTSGLGYLIIDARNAGKRYDLVVAGMVMIGLIGLGLDVLVRRLEKFDEVRWGLLNRR